MVESHKVALEKKKSVNPRAEEVNHRCYIKYFRDTLAEFTKEEVALITGLPFYGKALDLQSKKISDIRLLQKHFPDKHLHMKDVRAKLIQLHPSNEEEDKQDFVRASAVHHMIIEDLRLFAKRIRRRDTREGVSLGYIGGCTAALMGRTNDKSPLVRCFEQFHLLTANQVDPELNIGQQEEHLFRPHEEALVLEKLKMGIIQRRIKEGIIEGKGKRKLVEVAEESRGKKKREEEKKGEESGEEESKGKKKREQEAKRGEEVLIKELRKQNNQLQHEVQRFNKCMQTMKVDHGLLIQNLQKQIASLQSVHKDPPAEPSTLSMPQQGISPLSNRNMDLSEALAVVDNVVGDSTSVIKSKNEVKKPPKKPTKKTIAPTRRSERLNPTPPSMIIRIKKQPRNNDFEEDRATLCGPSQEEGIF
ncbi:hypothetical protein QJS04_geneDACA018809 [Acorus gramineus]|uniref:Uncharacterized protein n=1 Tax=Acorus gramineus TaxID=55184 RepID=A0AAV9BS80_ACOGR|nr:hypothetical protein QJS04_geneDACA018809 [Acorus gramineus]